MLIVKYLFKLLKAISSEAKPWQLAAGFVLGMVMGLTPLISLHNLFILAAILLLKVNIGMALLALSVCSGLAYLLDPFFDTVGYQVLTAGSLQSFWVMLYNQPVVALTNFYNTIVMGSLVLSVVLSLPVYVGVQQFVLYYRENIHERIQKWKIVQVLKSSKLYSVYQHVTKFRGS